MQVIIMLLCSVILGFISGLIYEDAKQMSKQEKAQGLVLSAMMLVLIFITGFLN